MSIAAHVISVVLALGMVASGSLKVRRNDRIVASMAAVGVRGRLLDLLGGLQIAGAIGLVVGLWIPALGIVAAVCLTLYFAGAIGAHVRARDPEWQAAAVLLIVSAATFIVLVVTG